MSYGLTHVCAESMLAQFASDEFKVALYNAELDQALAAYTTAGEIVGGGYPAGGYPVTMTVIETSSSNYTLEVIVDDVITLIPGQVQSLMIYNVTQANRSVMVAPVIGAVAEGTLLIRFTMPIIVLTV